MPTMETEEVLKSDSLPLPLLFGFVSLSRVPGNRTEAQVEGGWWTGIGWGSSKRGGREDKNNIH